MKIIFISMTLLCMPLCADFNAHTIQRYLWANYHHATGNTKKSLQWYKQLFTNPSSVYTYKGYIKFLYDTGNHEQILKIMPNLKNTFSKDPDTQLILVRAYKSTGNKKEADNLIIKLSQEFKTHPEITFHAVETYIGRKELENALITIDHYLNKSPAKTNNFVFYFLKAQIYTQLNKYEEAMKNVKDCLAMHHHFDKGWLLFAILEETAGKIEESLKGYTKYLEITEDKNPVVENHLLELTLKQKSIEQQTNVLLINKTCLEKCLILMERKQYNRALKVIDECLAQKPDDDPAKLVKIQILSHMFEYEKACTTLAQWINQNIHDNQWMKTLYLLSHSGAPIYTVIKAFEHVHANHPQELTPILYLADLCARSNAHEKAIAYHTKALPLTNDNDLKTKIYFHLGLVYFEHNDYEKMKEALVKAQTLQKADMPSIHNLFAYYYATKGKDLTKAHEHITRALNKDPHNPHFLDTQATILYKQKKYDHAHTILSNIAQKQPYNATILTHLAQTEHALGNIQNSHNILKKAHLHAQTVREKNKIDKIQKQWNQIL